MSFNDMGWAFKQELPLKEKMTLIALASHCNEKTKQCNPSFLTLAKECGMSRDSVIRAIKTLEEKRLITPIRQKIGLTNLSNQYQLIIDGSSSEQLGSSSEQLGSSSEQLGSSSEQLGSSSEQLEGGSTQQPKTITTETIKETSMNHKETTPKKAKNSGDENEQAKKEMGFKKPTMEQLESYINENGFSVDAGRFFDYYESNGWLVSKAPMKNWQAAVRNWVRRDFNKGGSNATHQQYNKPAKLSGAERIEKAIAERNRNQQSMATVIEGEFKYG